MFMAFKEDIPKQFGESRVDFGGISTEVIQTREDL